MPRRPHRGSALVVTMIVLLVLAILSVAMIRFTSRELAGAIAARQQDALVSCAEAGRQLILSQFRSAAISPSSLVILNDSLGGADGATRVVGGHIDTTAAAGSLAVDVEEVTVLPAATFGVARASIRDLSNIISGAAQLGGTPYRIIVHCQDHGTTGDPASGRQLEVEFGLRFGL
jgi:hypothetical protein